MLSTTGVAGVPHLLTLPNWSLRWFVRCFRRWSPVSRSYWLAKRLALEHARLPGSRCLHSLHAHRQVKKVCCDGLIWSGAKLGHQTAEREFACARSLPDWPLSNGRSTSCGRPKRKGLRPARANAHSRLARAHGQRRLASHRRAGRSQID